MMGKDIYDGVWGYRVQKTLRAPLTFNGAGLHSGVPCKLVMRPAPANYGVVFIRTDLTPAVPIPAHFHSVVDTRLATSLASAEKPEARVSTVEHVLAALFSLGVQNVAIEIDGPEIPILDGSAAPFVDAILESGVELQAFTAQTLRVLKPIRVYHEGTVCELLPRDHLRLTTSVEFSHPMIGLQTYALEATPNGFINEIARARTFGFFSDLEKLRARNLALGASLENVLAFTEDGVLNPEGMRYGEECVRHKLLDALGDLSLCGAWVQGELVSFRGGHKIHYELLKSLENFPTHWALIPPEPIAAVSQTAQLSAFQFNHEVR